MSKILFLQKTTNKMETINIQDLKKQYLSFCTSNGFHAIIQEENDDNEKFAFLGNIIQNAEVNRISAENIYILHDRYGFPLDFICDIAQEKGMIADTNNYRRLLSEKAEYDIKVKNIIQRNRAAADLLIYSLSQVMGEKIEKAGMHITADKLRVDIPYPTAISKEQLRKAEELSNEIILSGKAENNIGLIHIISERSAAAGIRRIEAASGTKVIELLDSYEKILHDVMKTVNANQINGLPYSAEKFSAKLKKRDLEIEKLMKKLSYQNAEIILRNAEKINGLRIAYGKITDTNAKMLRMTSDALTETADDCIAVIAGIDNDKADICVCCGKTALSKGADAEIIIKNTLGLPLSHVRGNSRCTAACVDKTEKTDDILSSLKALAAEMIG